MGTNGLHRKSSSVPKSARPPIFWPIKKACAAGGTLPRTLMATDWRNPLKAVGRYGFAVRTFDFSRLE